MASHGVPRTQSSGVQTEEEKQKELVKINEYLKLVEQVNEVLEHEEFTHDSLALTSKLLTLNPEYYTIWNHRRRILQALFPRPSLKSDSDEADGSRRLISSDLQFLLPLLIKYPKCYWIWNHRIWLLRQSNEQLPLSIAEQFWTQELGLVGKMLARDSRNFHGWNYRRFVIAELRNLVKTKTDNRPIVAPQTDVGPPSSPQVSSDTSLTESEFLYTTKMIKTNFSNFSAWHNRSKLIPLLLNERGADDQSRRQLFDDELDLLHSALFTDPYDQSLWFYHEFLMSELLSTNIHSFLRYSREDQCEYLEKEIDAIKELLEDTDDCKMIYQHLLYYTEQYLEIEAGNSHVSMREMRSWLSQLIKLDGLRKGRWEDLAKRLHLEEGN